MTGRLEDALRGFTASFREISTLLHSIEDGITHEEIEQIFGEETDEVILEAEGLRLIVADGESLSWKSGERSFGGRYSIPNVVRIALMRAVETGVWDREYAIREYFRMIEDPLSGIMPALFDRIRRSADSGKISASRIADIASGFGIRDAGALIAELKGAGLISPWIRPGMDDAYYEIHPLF
ncbi:MAG TPA: hypothetical protein ENG09_07615 [Candidatus Syntrophoarchaeum butanivorans]|uniref:Uncharacterized protein n=1 Tax=Candidatus Syntropharchaeum butanivorans TaxID=1839936 RepID=A0A7C0X2C1_9EURY|nr:hypothetical protein [Candidatus Syntrophoarchaeum butanivorans]